MITRRRLLSAVGSTTAAIWLGQRSKAQPPPTVPGPYRAPKNDFPPVVIIGDAERYRLRLQIADNSIQDYVRQSFTVIAEGHKAGFKNFSTWYRAAVASRHADEATNDLMAKLFGFALKEVMNLMFPESGTFVEKLKEAARWSYDQAASRLGRIPDGDINRFLDEHEARVEDVISSWYTKAEEVRHSNAALWDEAKNQFILEQLDVASPTSELGPQTRQVLEQLGVPQPNEITSLRFKAQVMAAQVTEVLWDWQWSTMVGSRWETRNMAMFETLRQIYPDYPEIYCVPQRHVRDFFRTPTCRDAIHKNSLADVNPR
jgi:hypothetical protein